MGDVIVISILAVIIALVIRSMWRAKKSGRGCGGCTGNCARCEKMCK